MSHLLLEAKSSDYLVVEDPDKSSSWHLPVRKNGKPDHRLMGAAWAALHGGYRGNKYEGPDKAAALKKLKALYKSEKLDLPSESAEVPDSNLSEMYGYETDDMPYVPWGARSFQDLQAAEEAQESSLQIRRLAHQFKGLVDNVISDVTVSPKFPAIQSIADEFLSLIGQALGEKAEASNPEPEGEPLAESISGSGITLVEAEFSPNGNTARDPLKLDVRLITPGWGNARDNHYYPASVLKRDAHIFEGAKMYTTDHKPNEKSTRTEVSVIEKIVRFDENGSPIARVNVFDPDFAEQTRNRVKAGLLETLECSILAYGNTKPGTAPDGKKGNIVEAITGRQSVDWVTKAGAGGGAVNLAEAGAIMDKETEVTQSEGQTTPTQETEEAAPVLLSEADVKAALDKSKLPEPARQRLAEKQFKDQAELDAAVNEEIAYVKAVTGSGKPVTSSSGAARTPRSTTLAESNKVIDSILEESFGLPARKEGK